MKTFILATLLSATAFAGAANAGLMVDATKGPIQITVSGSLQARDRGCTARSGLW